LLQVLSPEEFLQWFARYEMQPWGERRADLRQLVLLSYLLAPFQGDAAPDMPELVWPYGLADGPEVDMEATGAALAEHFERCYSDLIADGPQDNRIAEHPGGGLDGDPAA
jgi:hypothetical protein